MGIKTIQKKERFVFETKEERDVLEKARNYFQSSRLLLNNGLGYNVSGSKGSSYFYKIKKGASRPRRVCSISTENWKRVQEYASRFDKGERYSAETFVRPVIGALKEEA